MPTSIELCQTVDCDPIELWRACTTLSGIARWQADETAGSTALGGEVVLRWPALQTQISLRVVERVEGVRIRFFSGTSTVSLGFEGKTLTLCHSGLETEDERDGTSSSWQLSLALLKHALERHPTSTRRVLWAMERMRITHETAHVFFTDRNALKGWLCSTATDLASPAARYELVTAFGDSWQGEVLSLVPDRDVLISIDSRQGAALALRTLPLPDEQRLVALSYSSWTEVPDAALEANLSHALARLSRLVQHPASA